MSNSASLAVGPPGMGTARGGSSLQWGSGDLCPRTLFPASMAGSRLRPDLAGLFLLPARLPPPRSHVHKSHGPGSAPPEPTKAPWAGNEHANTPSNTHLRHASATVLGHRVREQETHPGPESTPEAQSRVALAPTTNTGRDAGSKGDAELGGVTPWAAVPRELGRTFRIACVCSPNWSLAVDSLGWVYLGEAAGFRRGQML